jgi:hypothetical protein
MPCDTLVDEYTDNEDFPCKIFANFPNADGAFGECFTTPASAYYICQAQLRLKRVGNPDGKLEARLYRILSGRTCGTNAKPEGTPATAVPLATSESIEMSTVGTGSFAWYEFNFTEEF